MMRALPGARGQPVRLLPAAAAAAAGLPRALLPAPERRVRGGGRPRPASESWLFIDDLLEKATGSELIILLALYLGTSVIAGLIMTGRNAARTSSG